MLKILKWSLIGGVLSYIGAAVITAIELISSWPIDHYGENSSITTKLGIIWQEFLEKWHWQSLISARDIIFSMLGIMAVLMVHQRIRSDGSIMNRVMNLPYVTSTLFSTFLFWFQLSCAFYFGGNSYPADEIWAIRWTRPLCIFFLSELILGVLFILRAFAI